jgi:hypothetical protein
MSKSKCQDCRHFYITWDQSAPYGCKLFQMKTKLYPNQIVKAAGSGECEGYEAKTSQGKGASADKSKPY